MNVTVHDQFWSTLGGGERYAGGIAEALLDAGHDVTLLAYEPLDVAQLEERLGLRLGGARVEVVDGTPDAVTDASRRADLFVNASFLSPARAAAARSVYIVYFPALPELQRSAPRRWVAARGRWLLGAGAPPVEPVAGLHPPDVLRRHAARWTTGAAELRVDAPPGEAVPVHVALGRYTDPELGPVPVEAVVDGEVVASTSVVPVLHRHDLRRVTWLRFTVRGSGDGQPVPVLIRSSTHRPAELHGGTDARLLGVPLLGVHAGRGVRARLVAALPGLLEAPATLDYLDTYDELLSISEYTRAWVRRLWGRESGLLYPPVTLFEAGEKRPQILSVGRFFARGSGHSKKQLELVEAFRRLCAGGLSGWTLHLVGGCAPEHAGYVAEVEAAAAGLPVEVHVGASGAEVRQRYAEASIYWHATGLGEDDERHPDRFEHFGITTAEAMSAGAVPVVIGAAGQREVVRDGIDGYWFDDLDGLVDRTRHLIADEGARRRMSEVARAGAQRFGPDSFRRAVLELL